MQTLDEAIGSAEAAIAEGRDAILDLRSGSAPPSDPAHLLVAAWHELYGRILQVNRGKALVIAG
jgi:hypothetical protein